MLVTKYFLKHSPSRNREGKCWHWRWNVGALCEGGPSVPLCDPTVPPLIKTGSWISCPPGNGSDPPQSTLLMAQTIDTVNPQGAISLCWAWLNQLKLSISRGQSACVPECEKNNVPACHCRLATNAAALTHPFTYANARTHGINKHTRIASENI